MDTKQNPTFPSRRHDPDTHGQASRRPLTIRPDQSVPREPPVDNPDEDRETGCSNPACQLCC